MGASGLRGAALLLGLLLLVPPVSADEETDSALSTDHDDRSGRARSYRWTPVCYETFEGGWPTTHGTGCEWTVTADGNGYTWDEDPCMYGVSPPSSAWCQNYGNPYLDPCEDSYTDGTYATMTVGPFDLDCVVGAKVDFHYWLRCQETYDQLRVEWRTPYASQYEIYTGDGGDEWYYETIELPSSAIDDGSFQISFMFCTNGSGQFPSIPNGAFIDDVTVSLEQEPPPNPPYNVTATTNHCDYVEINWVDGSDNEDGYRIYRDSSEIGTMPPNMTQYLDVPPSRCVTYHYEVTAYNCAGESQNPANDDGLRKGPPDAPTNCAATDGLHRDRIQVTWVDHADGDCQEDGFEIYRDGNLHATVGRNVVLYNDFDVNPCVYYWYYVKAFNDCGASQGTDWDRGHGGGTPEPPSNCAATDGTYCDKVRVTWVDNSSSPCQADSFKIYREGMRIATVGAGVLQYDDTSASPCQTYSYYVRAHNGWGDSAASNSNDGTRKGAPAQPSNCMATEDLCDRVLVEWVDNSEGICAESEFRVYRDGSQIGTVGANVTSYDDMSTTPCAAHTYHVTSWDNCGESVASNSDTGVQMDVPAAPTACSATEGLLGRVDVTWMDMSSGVCAEDSFMVYRDDALIGMVEADVEIYVDHPPECHPTTHYSYKVAAWNGCGYSDLSNTDSGWCTPQADLVVMEIELDPEEPCVPGDNDVRARALVRNEGGLTTDPTTTRFWIDMFFQCDLSTSALDPGGEQWTTWCDLGQLGLGAHEVEACADFGDQIDEADEGNNCLSLPFGVTECPCELDCYVGVVETGLPYPVIIESATSLGGPLSFGDEIGLFDEYQGALICVGTACYNDEQSFPMEITAWEADGGLPGFTQGSEIDLRLGTASCDSLCGLDVIFSEGGHYGEGTQTTVASVDFGGCPVGAGFGMQGDRWEFFGSYIVPTDLGAPEIFAGLDSLDIVQNDEGGVYIPELGIDTISPYEIIEGYSLFVDGAADSFTVTGTVPDLDETPIPIAAGRWNLIPYLNGDEDPNCADDITVAMASIEACVDVVEDGDGNVWIPEEQINTIGMMIPGAGYKIFLSCPDDELLYYPVCGGGDREAPSAPAARVRHFHPVITGLPEIVLVKQLASELVSRGDELAILCGDEVVGAAVYQEIQPFPLAVWRADPEHGLPGFIDGEPMRAMLWDEETGALANVELINHDGETPVFSSAPYTVVSVGPIVPGPALSQCPIRDLRILAVRPNPMGEGSALITYQVPRESRVAVTIHDLSGRLVRMIQSQEQAAGVYSVRWNGRDGSGRPTGSGVFFARVRAGSATTEMRLLIVW